MSTQAVDYAALAKQYGATNSQGPVDYTALAQKFGATNSTTPEPTERFARSFNKAITGAETPQQYVEQHQNDQGPSLGATALGAAPLQQGWQMLKGAHQQMQQVWNRAVDDFSKGNVTSAQGLVNYLNAGIHAVESGVPVVGPMLAAADQQLGAGNLAGAAGTVAGAALPFAAGAAGAKAGAGVPAEIPETAAVTTPGQVGAATRAVNQSGLRTMAGKAATAVSDVVDPNITGIFSPRLANIQRTLGRVGKALTPQEAAGEATAAPTAAETAAGAPKPQPAAQASQEATEAQQVPSQDDVAVGLGFPGGAKQAQQRMGPQQWQSTYERVTAPESASVSTQATHPESAKPATPEAVVDQAIPPGPLNMATKAKVDFYVEKGDVAAAKQAITDAADKLDEKATAQEFEQRYGTDFQPAKKLNWQADYQRLQYEATQHKVPTSDYGRAVYTEQSRLHRAAASAEHTLSGESAAQRVANLPSVGGSMAENKMLGYNPMADYEAAKANGMVYPGKPMPPMSQVEAEHSPWGISALPPDSDLTAILQKSVDAVKKGRRQPQP